MILVYLLLVLFYNPTTVSRFLNLLYKHDYCSGIDIYFHDHEVFLE